MICGAFVNELQQLMHAIKVYERNTQRCTNRLLCFHPSPPHSLVALDPIPDVLLDAATYTTAYPWMNPQLEPELYDGPVLENLYDPRPAVPAGDPAIWVCEMGACRACVRKEIVWFD